MNGLGGGGGGGGERERGGQGRGVLKQQMLIFKKIRYNEMVYETRLCSYGTITHPC